MVLAQPAPSLNAELDENAQTQHLTAAATLRRANVFVYCTVNTATDDWTLTLPPVSEAQGMIVYIYVTMANAKTLTVQDNADDAGMTDLDMDADADDVVLFSTGKFWVQLYNGIA